MSVNDIIGEFEKAMNKDRTFCYCPKDNIFWTYSQMRLYRYISNSPPKSGEVIFKDVVFSSEFDDLVIIKSREKLNSYLVKFQLLNI